MSGMRARQRWTGLWRHPFGFFGIQVGFALQNANASRIFQSLGTPLDRLGLMWIAAPLTGLLVQPLVGHFSDRPWTRLGRRRPFFLAGAILAALALVVMPNAGMVAVAAATLWLLDASLNICMEPFRAFVGDMLVEEQQPAGYAFQTAFIGAGAVLASLAPWLLEHVFHLANTAPAGQIPPTVRIGFYLGAAALLGAVLWTVVTTREYPPEVLAPTAAEHTERGGTLALPANGWRWIAGGIALGLAMLGAERIGWLGGAGEALLVAACLVAFGAAQLFARWRQQRGAVPSVIAYLVDDLASMPAPVKRPPGPVPDLGGADPDVDLRDADDRAHCLGNTRSRLGAVRRGGELGRHPVRQLFRDRRDRRVRAAAAGPPHRRADDACRVPRDRCAGFLGLFALREPWMAARWRWSASALPGRRS